MDTITAESSINPCCTPCPWAYYSSVSPEFSNRFSTLSFNIAPRFSHGSNGRGTPLAVSAEIDPICCQHVLCCQGTHAWRSVVKKCSFTYGVFLWCRRYPFVVFGCFFSPLPMLTQLFADLLVIKISRLLLVRCSSRNQMDLCSNFSLQIPLTC